MVRRKRLCIFLLAGFFSFASSQDYLPGSCADAGHSEGCCTGSSCTGITADGNGTCHCDGSCHDFSDCCSDIEEIGCPPPRSCADAGHSEGCCTGSSCTGITADGNSTCYCDRLCHDFKDCCSDIEEIGCPPPLSTMTTPCTNDGDVYLTGGSSSSEGTVQLCYNNQWGTVCDDSWDDNDAVVVCRQLGYSSGISTDFAHFGFGTGEIEVACSGDEQTLLQCNATTSHDCSHYEDAGVICGSNSTNQCISRNRLTPLPTAPDNLYEIDVGRFYEITCSSSLSDSTVTWMKLNQDGQYETTVSGISFVTLTFFTFTGQFVGIQAQDAGTYVCVSESVYGSTTNVTIQIQVLVINETEPFSDVYCRFSAPLDFYLTSVEEFSSYSAVLLLFLISPNHPGQQSSTCRNVTAQMFANDSIRWECRLVHSPMISDSDIVQLTKPFELLFPDLKLSCMLTLDF